MELDYKYILGIVLLIGSVGLFYTARIDQATFISLVAMVLSILGISFNMNEVAKIKKAYAKPS